MLASASLRPEIRLYCTKDGYTCVIARQKIESRELGDARAHGRYLLKIRIRPVSIDMLSGWIWCQTSPKVDRAQV